MPFTDFTQLFEQLEHNSMSRTVAVVCASDPHALEAVVLAANQTSLSPILVGQRDLIVAELAKLNTSADRFPLLEADTVENAALAAAALIREGTVHLLMKGAIPTGVLLRTLMAPDVGFRTGGLLSHVSFVHTPAYHKIFAITDAALNIQPDLAQKQAILQNAVSAMRALGIDTPLVAIIAGVETVNPKMPETLDADALKQAWKRGEIPHCIVEGPLSYDLAMSPDAAQAKNCSGPVYGNADLLLLPNMVCGNVLIKSLRYGADASSAGFIVGGKVPIVLTSRAAPTRDKLLPLRLAAHVSL